ncbi:MAG: polyprenyl synthetase family protein [Candidatus Muiribacteriota bacterium]
MNEQLKKYIENVSVQTEKELEKFHLWEENQASKIIESMKYSLFAGGKRIRPVLAMLSADMLGVEKEKLIPFCCAIEMVHTYSLIHDDLPAMDNDDLRRGKPTNHKVYGEALAILAGDALLTHAFYVLSHISEHVGYEQFTKIIKLFSEYSGFKGMVGGQTADMLLENNPDTTFEDLKFIHSLKTGKLLEICIIIPAIIAGVEQAEMEEIYKLGQNIGLLFQITDDLLDVTGSAEKLGKTPGKDAKSNKNTYIKFFGVEKTREIAEQTYEEIKKTLNKLKADNLYHELVEFIYRRDY